MAASKEPDYKALRAELDAVLERMQSDELDVDEALASFERGKALINQMKDYLKTVENKIVKRRKEQ